MSDLASNSQSRSLFSLAGLPDGRVAMAYLATGGVVKVGFYSGTAWGAFTAVPMVTAATFYIPISIARGAHGSAVLELAYLDTAYHVAHTRLTSEAQWTWSTPATVAATQTYGLVSIAVGP